MLFPSLLALLALGHVTEVASPPTPLEPKRHVAGLPSGFEENLGQHADDYAYIMRGLKVSAGLLHDGSAVLRPAHGIPTILRVKNSKPAARTRGVDRKTARSHYFLGGDPEKWRRNVPLFRSVIFEDILEGIDLEYLSLDGTLRFDFVVAPGARPEKIRWAFENAQSASDFLEPRLTSDGLLTVSSDDTASLRFSAPVAFQWTENGNRESVPIAFQLLGEGEVGFEIGPYDTTRPLRIDPTILAASYLGGNAGDRALDLDLDDEGNLYVVGITQSLDFPTLSGVQMDYGGGNWDCFVSKIDPSGETLLYSTYLGGSGFDLSPSVAVDGPGNAHVLLRTISTDYPTLNALQPALNGAEDLAITKINPSGDEIIYSTYLGGSGVELIQFPTTVDLADNGNLYVTGTTNSLDYPLQNAIQSSLTGDMCTFNNGDALCFDYILSVLSADGSSLLYSTYFGRQGDDTNPKIAVDSMGDAYLGFATDNDNYPTVLAPQSSPAGDVDFYLAKIRPDGSPPLFATYWGGSMADAVLDIGVDHLGRAVAVGLTGSVDFPTVDPIQPFPLGNCADEPDFFPCFAAAAVRFNPRGTAIEFSTAFGGTTAFDTASAVSIDAVGNLNIGGYTWSDDFPVVDPVQATLAGESDSFLMLLRGGIPEVLSTTYLGGLSNEFTWGLGFGARGVARLSGHTRSSDFPVVDPIQPDFGGGNEDGFVALISPDRPVLALEERVPVALGEPASLPLALSPGGLEISSLAFSIDLPDCLDFDVSDNDANGLPDGLSLQLPPGFSASASVDLGDTDGELDVVILDLASPLDWIPTSFLGELIVTPLCPPAGDEGEIEVPFSTQPEPSFGTTTGASVPGVASNGSVTILEGDRGDCNSDGVVDAGDLSACVLELFDNDGTLWLDVPGGSFPGSPLGCDANEDQRVDAGDISCKQLLIFQGPGSCAQPTNTAGPVPSLSIDAPVEAIVGDSLSMVLSLDPAGLTVRSLVFALDLGPGLVIPPDDIDEDGLPDAIIANVPPGFELAFDVHLDRDYAELSFAILPPNDFGTSLPQGAFLELHLTAESASSVTGLWPTSELPFSAGDSQGASFIGEIEGVVLTVFPEGWLFGDGFESGTTSLWSASNP